MRRSPLRCQPACVTRLTTETHAKILADYPHAKPTAAFDLAPRLPHQSLTTLNTSANSLAMR